MTASGGGRRGAVLAAACVVLVGCDLSPPSDGFVELPGGALAFDPYADPSYPPLMGTIVLTSAAGDRMVWNTYDYSVGAFDAAAWFADTADGGRLTLIGRPEGQPRAETGLIRIEAPFTGAPGPGMTFGPATIIGHDRGTQETPDLRSQTAAVTLTAFDRSRTDVGSVLVDGQELATYGEIAGEITARLCPVDGSPCEDVSGSFATEVQFDGI